MPKKPGAARYRARDARQSALRRLVLDHLEEFAARLKDPAGKRPRPRREAEDHFRRFIECGILRFGAARYRCPGCGEDLFAAFSCKRRGLCPSCDAKRAAIAVFNALDRLLPEAPYRQWVLVVPKRLRFFINRRPDLSGEVSRIFARVVGLRLRRKSGDGDPAQVHFIQRAGSALNLHVHIHAVVSDGLFGRERGALGGSRLAFRGAAPPGEEEIARLTESVRRKVLRRFLRLGALPEEAAREMLAWEHSGFSIHAKVAISAKDRVGLQRLLAYCARPALSEKRFSYWPKRGLAVYRPEERKASSPALTFAPVEFLRRWALLAPPPRKNLLRYYGALGPNSPLRPLLVAAASRGTAAARLRNKTAAIKEAVSERIRSWAACLARVFEVDPLKCPRCSKRMIPFAVIMEDCELVRLLTYLKLPTSFPKTKPSTTAAARDGPEHALGPPDDGSQLSPQADLYDGVDPWPVDD